MFDPDRRRCLRGPVIPPSDIARQHVFRALEPFKADGRSSGCIGMSGLHGAPSESVDLLPHRRRLRRHLPALQGNANPWVWDVAIEHVGMKAVENFPGVSRTIA